MDEQERRRETRVDVRVPLRFRPISNPYVPEQSAETENVSQLGIYFTTDFPLAVGATLVLWLTMPSQVTGAEPREVRCIARVVHVQPTGRLVRHNGVGLRIEQFASAARAERWAS
jgi:Tfp pilus assembly protein PilZ